MSSTGVFSSRLAEKGWYTGDPSLLQRDLTRYLTVPDADDLTLSALILPHAGYAYSGPTAGKGATYLQGKSYSRVIIIGPSHYYPLTNQASVLPVSQYETPLGHIPLDTTCIQTLLEHPEFVSVEEIHMKEHSVQMEIPFVQACLSHVPIVPIVVGTLDVSAARSIAQVLRSIMDEDTLVIVSSDFTHFGASFGYMPFTTSIESNIRQVDMTAVDYISAKDFDGFHHFLMTQQPTICGRHAILVLLAMLSDDMEPDLFHYTTSAKEMGDWSHSVSYVSLGFTGSWGISGGDHL